MTQDELKQAVARAALDYVPGGIIGVGTGSTARLFIEALAGIKERIVGAVPSSEDTRRRLEGHGIRIFDLNEIESMPMYIDGADEINAEMHMIKGGGGEVCVHCRWLEVCRGAGTFPAAGRGDPDGDGPDQPRDRPPGRSPDIA